MKKAFLSTVILLGIMSGLLAAVASADPVDYQPLNHGANYGTLNHGANYGTLNNGANYGTLNHGANY